MSYHDINPMDLDPDTGRPYSNYSSPSLDTSFHDWEMAGEDEGNGNWRGAAQARAKGFTRRVYIDGGMEGFEGLIKPDTDLDGQFKAWDLDEGEWLTVSGWLVDVENSQ